jgi:hypothetical protein
MLNAFVIAIRFIILVFSGHKKVALENAALRQQLAVFRRDLKQNCAVGDRTFWVALRMIWKEVGASDRSARYGDFLASQSLQTVLASIVTTKWYR